MAWSNYLNFQGFPWINWGLENYSEDNVVGSPSFGPKVADPKKIYEAVFIISVSDRPRPLSSPPIRSVSIWCANHISFDQTKKQFPSQWIRVKGGDGITVEKKVSSGEKKRNKLKTIRRLFLGAGWMKYDDVDQMTWHHEISENIEVF